MAGYATRSHVTIHADGSVSVVDDGRGIPVERIPTGLLHAGGRADGAARRRQVRPRHLQGLRRPARRRRDGRQRPLRMVRGRGPPRRPGLAAGVRARRAGPSPPLGSTEARGTKTTFLPDPRSSRASNSTTMSWSAAAELAFLNKGIKILLTRRAERRGRDVPLERGILRIRRVPQPRHEPAHADIIYVAGEYDGSGPGSRLAVHGRSPRTSTPTSTTSTPSRAAPTCPASAPPDPHA